MTDFSTSPFRRRVSGIPRDPRACRCIVAFLLTAVGVLPALASENVPHRPFAEWANLPERHQFIFGMVYEEAEAYHIWAGGKYRNVNVDSGGEEYGIDNHQGYFALQYGINQH